MRERGAAHSSLLRFFLDSAFVFSVLLLAFAPVPVSVGRAPAPTRCSSADTHARTAAARRDASDAAAGRRASARKEREAEASPRARCVKPRLAHFSLASTLAGCACRYKHCDRASEFLSEYFFRLPKFRRAFTVRGALEIDIYGVLIVYACPRTRQLSRPLRSDSATKQKLGRNAEKIVLFLIEFQLKATIRRLFLIEFVSDCVRANVNKHSASSGVHASIVTRDSLFGTKTSDGTFHLLNILIARNNLFLFPVH